MKLLLIFCYKNIWFFELWFFQTFYMLNKATFILCSAISSMQRFPGWQSCFLRLISARVILRSFAERYKLNRFDYCFRRAAGLTSKLIFIISPLLFCFSFFSLNRILSRIWARMGEWPADKKDFDALDLQIQQTMILEELPSSLPEYCLAFPRLAQGNQLKKSFFARTIIPQFLGEYGHKFDRIDLALVSLQNV